MVAAAEGSAPGERCPDCGADPETGTGGLGGPPCSCCGALLWFDRRSPGEGFAGGKPGEILFGRYRVERLIGQSAAGDGLWLVRRTDDDAERALKIVGPRGERAVPALMRRQ